MRVSWLCQGSAKLIQHNVFAPKGHEEQLALPIDNAHISVALRARRCSIVPPKGTIRIESSDEILYPRGSSIYAASLGKANMRRAHTAPLGAGHFICPPGPLRGTKSGRRCPKGARAIYAQRGPFGSALPMQRAKRLAIYTLRAESRSRRN